MQYSLYALNIRLAHTGRHNSSLQAVTLKRLGRSDLYVPRLCFGTMLFGESMSRAEASVLLDECMEHDINFFDSAEMYV